MSNREGNGWWSLLGWTAAYLWVSALLYAFTWCLRIFYVGCEDPSSTCLNWLVEFTQNEFLPALPWAVAAVLVLVFIVRLSGRRYLPWLLGGTATTTALFSAAAGMTIVGSFWPI